MIYGIITIFYRSIFSVLCQSRTVMRPVNFYLTTIQKILIINVMHTINEPDLFNACKVLFGTGVRVDRRFLEYIQMSGLKSAYRKKALDTHPDRFVSMGEEYQRNCADQFREVAEAYEKLSKYLKVRESGDIRYAESHRTASTSTSSGNGSQGGYYRGSWGSSHQESATNGFHKEYKKETKSSYESSYSDRYSQRSKSQESFSNGFKKSTYSGNGSGSNGKKEGNGNYYSVSSDNNSNTSSYSYKSSKLPRRALRIGEFLYYSGAITWKDLIAALVWQTRQRERIGEIACRWGWLNQTRVLDLLKQRQRGERLGDVLLRLKLVSPFQLNMLLWQQQKNQCPIGSYFVKEGRMTEYTIKRHLKNLQDHNVGFSKNSKP